MHLLKKNHVKLKQFSYNSNEPGVRKGSLFKRLENYSFGPCFKSLSGSSILKDATPKDVDNGVIVTLFCNAGSLETICNGIDHDWRAKKMTPVISLWDEYREIYIPSGSVFCLICVIIALLSFYLSGIYKKDRDLNQKRCLSELWYFWQFLFIIAHSR